MNRNQRKLIAQETLNILNEGKYECNGKEINISSEMKESEKETFLVKYDDSIHISKEIHNFVKEDQKKTTIEIINETTLQGARRLTKKFKKVAVLNFASAKNAGGGFIKGSNAQEESLARSSSLYNSIKDSEYYEINKLIKNKCVYTDSIIYTPKCVVFRDDTTNDLLKTPYQIDVLTCPAVNAKACKKNGICSIEKVEKLMKKRVKRIIQLAIKEKSEAIILGSYGTGVFGNDVLFIATLFKKLITEEYPNYFDHVCFSIIGNHFFQFKEAWEKGAIITKNEKKGKSRSRKKYRKSKKNKKIV